MVPAPTTRQLEIVAAATRVFEDQGFAATSMDDVARHANMSKGGLYRHFSSKESLFATLLTVAAEELAELLAREHAAGPERSGLELVRAYANVAIRVAREKPGKLTLARECGPVVRKLDQETGFVMHCKASMKALFDRLMHALHRGQLDGSIRSDVHAEHLLISLWSASLGVLEFDYGKRTCGVVPTMCPVALVDVTCHMLRHD